MAMNLILSRGDLVIVGWVKVNPTGRAMSTVIRALVGREGGWSVVVGAVEGADIPGNLNQDGTPLTVPELLAEIENVRQFDWADFYLFSPGQSRTGFDYVARGYITLIPRVSYLVRAVDSSYTYVFSSSKTKEDLLRTTLSWGRIEEHALEVFDFPD